MVSVDPQEHQQQIELKLAGPSRRQQVYSLLHCGQMPVHPKQKACPKALAKGGGVHKTQGKVKEENASSVAWKKLHRGAKGYEEEKGQTGGMALAPESWTRSGTSLTPRAPPKRPPIRWPVGATSKSSAAAPKALVKLDGELMEMEHESVRTRSPAPTVCQVPHAYEKGGLNWNTREVAALHLGSGKTSKGQTTAMAICAPPVSPVSAPSKTVFGFTATIPTVPGAMRMEGQPGAAKSAAVSRTESVETCLCCGGTGMVSSECNLELFKQFGCGQQQV